MPAPSSCTPRITIHTGTTVHTSALTRDRPHTAQGRPHGPGDTAVGATAISLGTTGNQATAESPKAATTAHCSKPNTQAVLEDQPTSRKEPRRPTRLPLPIR